MENSFIRRVSEIHDVLLADVELAVVAAEPHGVPGETLFADHCHLNERGNKVLRQRFEQVLVSALNP